MRLKRRVTLGGGVGGLAAAISARHSAARAQPADAVTLAIERVALFDGTGSPLVPSATVLLSGDRILAVLGEPAPLPVDAPVIDGTGLTLLPGLIDAHAHFSEPMAPLYLRFGITTIRDVGNAPEHILPLREAERVGTLQAPRLVVHGPLIDGTSPFWPRISRVVATPEQARAVAADLLDLGLDGLKVYFGLTLDRIAAVCEVARERGAPVAAHLERERAVDAADAGVRSLEHAQGINYVSGSEPFGPLIDHLTARGTAVVPTLVMHRGRSSPLVMSARAERGELPHLDLVPPEQVRFWRATPSVYSRPDERPGRAAFLSAFAAAGGLIAAGSDVGNPWVIPGFSLHEEMELLVEAGLSPAQALRAATGAAAEVLQRPDLGVVAPGRLADLVLVRGDPTESILATRNIELVIKGGTVAYDPTNSQAR